MRFGLFGVNFGPLADPERQRRVVLAAEETGFESVWTGEHVVLPVKDNPVAIPAETPFLDSLVALTRIAGFTQRVKLATGILVLPHHNPVLLAKALASLDVVSGGRLIAGFGGGYAEAEFQALGVDFHRRGAKTDDALRALRALWTQDEPAHRGPFASFAGVRFEPKPVQRPHPPILFGGATAQGRARVVEYCDGWIPIDVLLDDLPAAIADLRRRADAAGRGRDALPVSVFAFQPPKPDALARLQDLGVERVTLVAPRRLADALPFLDRMASLKL